MRKLILLLLVACDARGPAELYRDALVAPTWDEGRALCARLPAPQVPDCLVAVMEAQGRLDPEDCAEVPEGVWRDECVFLYAEREARSGDLADAFAACERTAFGRECSFHLIREGARAVLDRPMAEAAAGPAAYQGLAYAPDAERLFWRTWFRERLSEKIPVDPTGCPTPACFAGARETVLLTLTGVSRAAGPAFCDSPAPDGQSGDRRLWADVPQNQTWVTEFVDRDCAMRRGNPRGPGGSPAGHAPPR